MTTMQFMQDFFFSVFNDLPDFLMAEPIIEFVSLIFGITVFALFMKIFLGGRKNG